MLFGLQREAKGGMEESRHVRFNENHVSLRGGKVYIAPHIIRVIANVGEMALAYRGTDG